MSDQKNIKSKLLVIVFLAIILLPVCFAALKELRHRQGIKTENPQLPAGETK